MQTQAVANYPVLFAVAGILIGTLVTWLLAARSSAKLEAELRQSKERLAEVSAEALRDSLALREALEQRAALQSDVKNLSLKLEEQKKSFEEEWAQKFESLSGRTLERVTEKLEEKAKKEFQDRQELLNKDINSLLEPITKLVKENEKKVQELGEQTIKETASLKTQLELSFKQTKDLIDAKNRIVNVLTDNKKRGDWGEFQLERLLEMSGLIKGRDYVYQPVQDDKARPDVLIHLPNRHILYIDVKTLVGKLEEFESGLEHAQSDAERKSRTESLRAEILRLNKKSYQAKHRDSLDFVILYVPFESMLRVPLEEFPTLMDEAFRNGVILSSPLVLMGVLKTVARGWDDARSADRANEVLKMGEELHKRSATFLRHFAKIGTAIKSLNESYEAADTSFTGRLGFIPQINRLEQLNIKKKDNALPERYRLTDSCDDLTVIDVELAENGAKEAS